jgi:hypothetical protein
MVESTMTIGLPEFEQRNTLEAINNMLSTSLRIGFIYLGNFRKIKNRKERFQFPVLKTAHEMRKNLSRENNRRKNIHVPSTLKTDILKGVVENYNRHYWDTRHNPDFTLYFVC